MKIKDGFILREVAGETVVIPTDDTLDLNMMITLNETGAFLWKQLEQDTNESTMVSALVGEYDVPVHIVYDGTNGAAVDQVAGPESTAQKRLRDGQLIILRDGKEYNALGMEM